ncbi:Leucyl/phenylalanyl-tRNA--protein transferase [Candidatus Rhodobacter oscarellae]|uniref:Leucyl/phenylalanyl-tRNA--protein transferase n=1 Tax=Candidatus Rhodobacter oscarellae TaxID=1675527 RepID=A0A0J9EC53_9RHOB|nr:leucyl/phenylalanyl-tRNA--protein transferase [Candidatus Rhodobacter lobularis]KMW60352.1 Leucyl/phenylalanyl-tRNA--protein transferase [Candidatus Rhodobacter lobularis]
MNAITPELLLYAYGNGIFPMAETRDDEDVFWVDPKRRGIIPLDGFRISRSLARRMRRGGYEVALNRDFAGVVEACADRDETWINDTIFDLYRALHRMGHAHSLEIRTDGALIGGVYGVTLGGAFFGESMFSRATDGSKIALAHLVDHLSQTGFRLFDAQFLTEHLASLGAIEISRADYHTRLNDALQVEADFLSGPGLGAPQDVIQRNNQRS